MKAKPTRAQLEAENKKLRQKVRTLAEELDHLGGRFIGSTRKQTFHRPECHWASFLIYSPNRIDFDTHREAVQAGYKPCKTCRA